MPVLKSPLAQLDPQVAAAVAGEGRRQEQQIELIASENLVSPAVLEAQGSVLTNKYAEGYPGKRYYGGCEFVDVAENIAIERARELFGAERVNVQPHSGSQANQAVLLALLKPGDTILGMDLAAGGHLTHGSAVNLSGRWFGRASYSVDPERERIDYERLARIAREARPRLIIAGGSAYSRRIDFARFRRIADDVGAYLQVDMAHIAGLVAAQRHPDPMPFAHVVTTTTHKTLRGPRGGMILTNDEALAQRLDKAVFPGLQGGPLMHVIAAKAVALGEALQPSFRSYIDGVLKNARMLASTLTAGGLRVVSGGTDTHLLLVDLRPMNVSGAAAEAALEQVGLTCNKNSIPFDPQPPSLTSGIRLGSAAATSRGLGADEFRQIGEWILEVLRQLGSSPGGGETNDRIREEVRGLCARFPVQQHLMAAPASAPSSTQLIGSTA